MINSRTKGAAFERQVAGILNKFFQCEKIDYACKRNLDQYQTKNLCDINIPFHAVECKAYKEGEWVKPEWWRQVCQSRDARIPVLVYKFNRRPVRVHLPLHAINTNWPLNFEQVAVLSMNDWLGVLKKNWSTYEQREVNLAS